MTAQFIEQLPIASSFAPECAFGHLVLGNESSDVAQDRVLFHEQRLSRVITRTSTPHAGDYTILREHTRALISALMESAPAIDMDKLRVDMAAQVERTSGRAFSRAVTGGKNPDWYRNFLGGQDKRISADIFAGIVSALGADPAKYIVGLDPAASLPSATVLTSALAALLETVGVDPFEDERAQKLARRFPDAIRRSAALHGGISDDPGSDHGGGALGPVEDRPAT